MTEIEIKRKLSNAVLKNWRIQHSPIIHRSIFGEREYGPASGYFVSCAHCEQAGDTKVFHDEDCPVRVARNILRGKK